MKPITINKLAWNNLKNKSFRTFCLIFITFLFSATLLVGTILMKNLSDGISGMANRLGADILIVPYGYEKNIEVALLRGEPSSFYLKADIADKIKSIKGITNVSSQLFITSLDSGCCSSKVQLIGFEQESDFVIMPWIKNKLKEKLKINEIVVGSKITANIGETIKFFNHLFTVKAKMAPTGMGFDTSVFMTLDAAHQLMKSAQLITGDVNEIDQFASSLFIKVDSNYQPKNIVNQIMKQYAIDYNLDFVMTKSMLTNINKSLNQLSTIIYGLSLILWLLAVIIIFVVHSSSLNERRKEVGILRILGFSRLHLVKMLFTESLLVSFIGGLTGICLGVLFLYAFNVVICQSLGLPCANLSISDCFVYSLGVFVLTLLISPLSCVYSILLITKTDSYHSLKEGD